MTEQFSLQVSRALDDLGYDEETRQYRTAKYGEGNFVNSLCAHRLVWQPRLSGSKVEGTSMYYETGFDYLLIHSNVKAIECEDLVQGDNDLTLLMENNATPPGYCKLQLLQSGWDNYLHRRFIRDNCYVRCHGYCRPHLSSAIVVDTDSIINRQIQICEKSGPANMGQPLGGLDVNTVQAIRCAHMPHDFKNWIRKHQDTDWPSKQTMEVIARSDIFLVPVGMQDSDKRYLQWRLSFHIQEETLIHNFTPVQYKIYILLKMIKTDIIRPQCPKFMTSYIVKTLMLWAVEQIPSQMWNTRNIIDLLFHILHMLHRCVKCVFCPKYFIPECNILHGRVTTTTQNIICDILSSLLSDRISCILGLPKILIKLYQYVFVPMPLREVSGHDEKESIAMHTVRDVHVHSLHITARDQLSLSWEQEQARIPYEELLTDLVSEPTPAGSEREKLLKHIFSHTMSKLALQNCADASIHNVSNTLKYRRVRQCIKILHGNRSNDVLCGRVRLGQVLCVIGQYKVAKDVLKSGADRIKYYMQKLSRRRTMQKYFLDQKLFSIYRNECVSTSQILKTFFVSDIQNDFQMELCLPKALQYEMCRSYHERRLQINIDSQTMLYYFQYLCHKEIGQRNHANVDFSNLVWCATRQESNIEYREIALNVLGHCLMKERLYDKAAGVLVRSVKLVNQYQHLGQKHCEITGLTPDIALWHIAILLNKVHRNS